MLSRVTACHVGKNKRCNEARWKVIYHQCAFEIEESLDMAYRESENRNARLDDGEGEVASTRQRGFVVHERYNHSCADDASEDV